MPMNASTRTLIRFFVLFLFVGSSAGYRRRPPGRKLEGQRGGPPSTPRTQAPFDMTGYWVSVVTEDWRWRMTTPPKGDYAGVPLNAPGIQAVKDWDPAKDEAAGQQCKSYGAANIMHVPGRLHITWQDDQTLKIETDSGMQTRLFHFDAANGAGGDWQGISRAEWELAIPGGYGARAGAGRRPGSLKVVDVKNEVRIFTEEWRALQRERHGYGVLRRDQ